MHTHIDTERCNLEYVETTALFLDSCVIVPNTLDCLCLLLDKMILRCAKCSASIDARFCPFKHV